LFVERLGVWRGSQNYRPMKLEYMTEDRRRRLTAASLVRSLVVACVGSSIRQQGRLGVGWLKNAGGKKIINTGCPAGNPTAQADAATRTSSAAKTEQNGPANATGSC
jgi:hypothetical protein